MNPTTDLIRARFVSATPTNAHVSDQTSKDVLETDMDAAIVEEAAGSHFPKSSESCSQASHLPNSDVSHQFITVVGDDYEGAEIASAEAILPSACDAVVDSFHELHERSEPLNKHQDCITASTHLSNLTISEPIAENNNSEPVHAKTIIAETSLVKPEVSQDCERQVQGTAVEESSWFSRAIEKCKRGLKSIIPRKNVVVKEISEPSSDPLHDEEGAIVTDLKAHTLQFPETNHQLLKESYNPYQIPIDIHSFVSDMERGFALLPIEFKRRYSVKVKLGEGAFGSVFLASIRDQPGELACVKVFHRKLVYEDLWAPDKDYGLIPYEAYFLKHFKHEGIVKFHDIFLMGDFFLLVTECFGTEWMVGNPRLSVTLNPGIPLRNGSDEARFEFRRKPYGRDLEACLELHRDMPRHTVRQIFGHIVSTVADMHQAGFVHGDIKAQNIVVDLEYRCRLIDFGTVTKLPENGKLDVVQGTPAYMAPELLGNKPYDGKSAESWAFGVLLYVMVMKDFPFDTDFQTRWRSPKFPTGVDKDIKDLIMRLLRKNPKKRMTLEECKTHPFLEAFFHRIP